MKCLVHKLTAALPEDNGAAEFVEPLGVEPGPVNRDSVLWGGGGGDTGRSQDVVMLVLLAYRLLQDSCVRRTHPVMDEGLPGVLQLLDQSVRQSNDRRLVQ